MKPTLFLLAAGMGSRYGGLKQLDGLGPNGETTMPFRQDSAKLYGLSARISRSSSVRRFSLSTRVRCSVNCASRLLTLCPQDSLFLRAARSLGVLTTPC